MSIAPTADDKKAVAPYVDRVDDPELATAMTPPVRFFITDASAFPSAAGVNPMLTVMALARRTAQRMLALG